MVIKKNRQTLMKETKMSTTLLLGNSLYKLQEIEDNSVDSIVTDPPYELGFMGKSWDNTGIAYNVELWRQCLRVLKPGGHLLAFGGTRTYHRMACAIEDAGFEIRDMIEWVYGSGFPKSLNIGKVVDKLQRNERDTVSEGKWNRRKINGSKGINSVGLTTNSNYVETKGASEWEGWGTALKPAHEPICMARKPLAEKTVAENCLKYGTGGINIDDSRVGTDEITTNGKGKQDGNTPIVPQSPDFVGETHIGRFPANLIHDNSEEVRECFPETKSQGYFNSKVKMVGHTLYEGGFKDFEQDDRKMNDCGNASRFFKSIIYTEKASKKDRGDGNNHPTVKPVALMQYLIQMVTRQGGIVLDPFMGSGTTGKAARNLCLSFIGIEIEEQSFKIAESRINEPTLFN